MTIYLRRVVEDNMEANVREKRIIKNHPTWIPLIQKHGELIAALSSGVIILTTWSLTNYLPHSLWISLHIIAFLIGGFAEGKEGILDTIENKKLNVELLMIIAAIGSAAIGYWTEGAILIFIFAFAGALETYTLNKSNAEISSLMNLQPEEARLIMDGKEQFKPVNELTVGQEVVIYAGERIPADGKIISGMTSVDESAITGESIPVEKALQQEVFASTVALDGTITVEITKLAHETVFQKIIDMVQTAKDEKPPTQLFIEKFEGMYVNIVLITVLIMMFLPTLLFDWTLTESIYRAMILLVVASPCALVASIMPATLSAISNSAKQGVLFKGGVHAENLSNMKTIAFDKTGTLTHGTPKVTDVYVNPSCDAFEIHEAVGAIENESTHPVAIALRDYTLSTLQRETYEVKVKNMQTIHGQGVTGTVSNKTWFIGKRKFAGNELKNEPFFHTRDQDWAQEGKTIVYVGVEERIVAIYALKDTVRPEAKKMITALQQDGIETMMLTGDIELTAKAVAEEIGISSYQAECLPGEKVKRIKKAQEEGEKVAMVGDGINDAPALATADIAIAMGEGTDVALETADVVLMKNNLAKINDSINISKRMNRIIKQNIFFSLSVIMILIASNFFQVIDLPLGVIGHEGSTILVILNGLRLLK